MTREYQIAKVAPLLRNDRFAQQMMQPDFSKVSEIIFLMT